MTTVSPSVRNVSQSVRTKRKSVRPEGEKKEAPPQDGARQRGSGVVVRHQAGTCRLLDGLGELGGIGGRSLLLVADHRGRTLGSLGQNAWGFLGRGLALAREEQCGRFSVVLPQGQVEGDEAAIAVGLDILLGQLLVESVELVHRDLDLAGHDRSTVVLGSTVVEEGDACGEVCSHCWSHVVLVTKSSELVNPEYRARDAPW